jgi:DNA-binding PadR family transcriptional regulator
MRGRGHRGRHRARRGDVRGAVVALLRERPMHGYEMIQELEERTGGRWKPSAGSIYPTLQLLEDEGVVTVEATEGKRVYALTEAGRELAEERGEDPAPWEQVEAASSFRELRDAAGQVAAAAMQVARAGDQSQVSRAVEILTEARRRLYSILAEE